MSLYERIVESFPNTPAVRLPYARDERYPSAGPGVRTGQLPEAPVEEPEQPLVSPGPGNVNARTMTRAAGSKLHIRRINRKPAAQPVSAKLHRRQLRTPTPGIPG